MYVCVCVCLQLPSRIQLFGVPWTVPARNSVHGIFQTRILEWVAISYCRSFTSWATKKDTYFPHLETSPCTRCIVYYALSILYTLLVWCVCLVSQSCLTLCESMDCIYEAPLSVEILQARLLEWVARASSRGSSQPRDRAQVSCVAGGLFYCLSHQGAWSLHMYSCACSFAF